jgi:hypothetical protein
LLTLYPTHAEKSAAPRKTTRMKRFSSFATKQKSGSSENQGAIRTAKTK